MCQKVSGSEIPLLVCVASTRGTAATMTQEAQRVVRSLAAGSVMDPEDSEGAGPGEDPPHPTALLATH